MENEIINETMSQTIGKLATALSKAQSMMGSAKADSENPFFKSKYADLSSVWEACRKPLGENKLAVVQTLGGNPETVEVITTLIHESGEWIRGTVRLKPVKADPQGVGSAITYGRRYGLTAMLGIVQDDDDGNAASRPPKDAGNPAEPPKKPELKTIPNRPLQDTLKNGNAINATETPLNDALFPDSVIHEIQNMTIWEAYDVVAKYALRSQITEFRDVVEKHCPERLAGEIDDNDIPENAIVAILEETTGLDFGGAE